MPEPIVFYDIPGTASQDRTWSPNTWKTRFSLNIKGIPYKTVWVEYPEIAALCKKLGVPPTSTNSDGSPHYTLPTIHDPNTGASVSDSINIARYLDKTYPSHGPTLIPPETDALHEAFVQAFQDVFLPEVIWITLPATARQLNPPSETYFRARQAAVLGKNLDDFPKPGSEEWEKRYAGVERALYKIKAWLEADGRAKLFFMGEKVSFADLTVAAWLLWIKKVLGAESDEWQGIVACDGGFWGKFMQEFEKHETVDAGSRLDI